MYPESGLTAHRNLRSNPLTQRLGVPSLDIYVARSGEATDEALPCMHSGEETTSGSVDTLHSVIGRPAYKMPIGSKVAVRMV